MMNLNWLIKRKCLLSVMVAFMAFYIQSVFADNYDSRTDLMAVYQISSPGSYELFGEGFDEMKIKLTDDYRPSSEEVEQFRLNQEQQEENAK